MANDICNSKCQMCLIWEQKKDHEVTVAEFEQLHQQPWLVAFGNHDEDHTPATGVDEDAQLAYYMTFPNNLSAC